MNWKILKSNDAFVLTICLFLAVGSEANFSNGTGNITRGKSLTDIYDKIFGESANYQPEVKASQEKGRRRLDVIFDINIRTILGLEVKTQTFHLTAVIHMRWKDKRLTWNESEFDGIDTLNVGNSIVWTPDIMLYNDVNEETLSHTEIFRSKVLIQSDGTVVWTNPVTIKSTCQVDVTWFPVDYQVCNLTFGSWSYSEQVMNIKFRNKKKDRDMIKSDFHIPSGEWSMEGIKFFEEEKTFECCKNPFSVITLQVFMKRYPDFYYLYVFLPFISQIILFLLIFHIHPDQGDRLSYGVALLLNMTMYMIFLSDKLPEKSDSVPYVGALFVTFFFLLSIALVLSAVTMHCSTRDTPVPMIAHKVKAITNRIWPCGKKSNARSKSSKYGSYNMKLRKPKSETDSNFNDPRGPKGDANRKVSDLTEPDSECSSVEIAGNDKYENRFEGWFEFMRFTEKWLTGIFAFLLVVIPIIIAGSVNTRMTQPDY